MNRFWSRRIKDIDPYVPGEQPKEGSYIKLNTNENPYPPSPEVSKVLREFEAANFRLYPDPECRKLKSAIADYYSLEENQIFVGNGSDEVLAFCFMAFFDKGNKVIFPDITYSFYEVYSNFFSMDFETVSLKEDFTIDVNDYIKRCRGIIIPNPNAPTGIYLSISDIEMLLSSNPDALVIIDEAYIDFGGQTAVPLVKDYKNLLITQTFSKSRSLAGLRIGFAIGASSLIEALERVKNSFNSYTVDRFALECACQSIMDKNWFEMAKRKVIRTREKTAETLSKMGFKLTDSKANFVFITHPKVSAKFLYKELRERGILVRYFDKPRINNHLRVTIGTDAEMDRFLQEIEQIVETA